MYIIYEHRCLTSNKSYVGLTSLSMMKRWKQHFKVSLLGSELHFHRAIRKYGENMWEHNVLQKCKTYEEACNAEIWWIKQLQTLTLGYNMTNGGDGFNGGNHTEKSKRLISESLMGRICSSETREKIKKTRLGKHLSKKSKEKISQASRKRFQDQEFRSKHSNSVKSAMKSLSQEKRDALANRKKAIIQLKDDKIINKFSSIAEAAISLNVTHSAISHALNGRAKLCKGFTWKFENEET